MRIDIHSHLLPTIDDGAKDLKTMLGLIGQLKRQGINEVCLTPHFYSNHDQLNEFIEKRNQIYNQVKPAFESEGIKTRVGAELLLSRNIFSNECINALCYSDTRYILVEIPTSIKKQRTLEEYLNKLYANYSVMPVIAHVERYKWLFNYKGLVWLNDIGCLVQFDNAALAKRRDRKKIIEYIDLGLIHLCGSDAHDEEMRNANFNLIEEFLDEEQLEYLFDNAKKLLYG